MFVDRALITVRAGHGGAGAVAFRRQKYEPKGGPKGGDGGRGGDVILVADDGMNTLLDFRGRPTWEAMNGDSGMKKQMHGSDGRNCVIRVPAGTMVYDHVTGELLVDMQPRQTFVIAKGGNGGFGNEHYKTADNQAPTYSHPGFPGDEKELRLELKLLADVGLLGMPNAGKSTLLAALTKANPKIANYPFTTLAPQLGVAELDPTRRIVIADIPGLIEGASEGAGLGLDFLRHVERTRVLVHLLDAMPPEGTPAEHYRVIRQELYNYSPVLAEREEIIVLNKLDLFESDAEREAAVKSLRKELKLGREVEVIGISAAARMSTRDLLEKLWLMLSAKEHTWDAAPKPAEPEYPDVELLDGDEEVEAAAPLTAQERSAVQAGAREAMRVIKEALDEAPVAARKSTGRVTPKSGRRIVKKIAKRAATPAKKVAKKSAVKGATKPAKSTKSTKTTKAPAKKSVSKQVKKKVSHAAGRSTVKKASKKPRRK